VSASFEAMTMNASLKPANLTPKATPSDAERQARIDLAAAYRLAAHFGLNEGIDNHLTVLVPGYSTGSSSRRSGCIGRRCGPAISW
jgi:hypothetical protein